MGEIRVQDEQGNVHVFPDGSTPEMIAKAMNVKVGTDYSSKMPDPGDHSIAANDRRWKISQGLDPDKPVPGASSIPGAFEGHPENIGQWVPSTFKGIGGGVYDLARGEIAKGGHEVISGVGSGLLPIAPFVAAGAPAAFAAGTAGGYAGGKVGQVVAHAAGATPEQEQFAADIGNVIGGVAGGLTPKAVAAAPIRKAAGSAASFLSDVVDPELVGIVSPRLAHVQKMLGRIGDRLNNPQLDLFRNTPKMGDTPAPSGAAAAVDLPVPLTQPKALPPGPTELPPSSAATSPEGVLPAQKIIVRDPKTGQVKTMYGSGTGPTLYQVAGKAVEPEVIPPASSTSYPIGVYTRFQPKTTTGTGAFNSPVRPLNKTFDLLGQKLDQVHQLLDEAGIPEAPPDKNLFGGTDSRPAVKAPAPNGGQLAPDVMPQLQYMMQAKTQLGPKATLREVTELAQQLAKGRQ